MFDPQVHSSPTRPVVQRMCAECEDEEDATLLTKRDPHDTRSSAAIAPPIVHDVLRSPGQPLDADARAFMEPRFGYDFSQVRIHTDTTAAESARAVHALAYTVGRDIVFGAGQFLPKTKEGKSLLAHELAHVTQQPAENNVRAARIGPPSDEYEQAAEAAAKAVVASPGEAAAASTVSGQASFERARPGNGKLLTPALKAPDLRLQRQTVSAECPPVPTGLGDREPEDPCPKAMYAGDKELARFRFCRDSDVLDPPGQSDELKTIIAANPRSTQFLIVGFSSMDGAAAYNLKLACHRANALRLELNLALRDDLRKRGDLLKRGSRKTHRSGDQR